MTTGGVLSAGTDPGGLLSTGSDPGGLLSTGSDPGGLLSTLVVTFRPSPWYSKSPGQNLQLV